MDAETMAGLPAKRWMHEAAGREGGREIPWLIPLHHPLHNTLRTQPSKGTTAEEISASWYRAEQQKVKEWMWGQTGPRRKYHKIASYNGELGIE